MGEADTERTQQAVTGEKSQRKKLGGKRVAGFSSDWGEKKRPGFGMEGCEGGTANH